MHVLNQCFPNYGSWPTGHNWCSVGCGAMLKPALKSLTWSPLRLLPDCASLLGGGVALLVSTDHRMLFICNWKLLLVCFGDFLSHAGGIWMPAVGQHSLQGLQVRLLRDRLEQCIVTHCGGRSGSQHSKILEPLSRAECLAGWKK